MKKNESPKPPVKDRDNREDSDLEGYPLYPESEDIYNKFKEEQDIDPEDPTRTKEPIPDPEIEPEDELDPEEDFPADELDVPGSELDDADEEIGNEDEENNYYSIGGDNHHDLEDGE